MTIARLSKSLLDSSCSKFREIWNSDILGSKSFWMQEKKMRKNHVIEIYLDQRKRPQNIEIKKNAKKEEKSKIILQ